jgi:hypothetical protein
MGERRFLCAGAILALAVSPFACTGGSSNAPPGEGDAGAQGSDSSVVFVDGSVAVDAASDVARAPDANDAAVSATDSPPPLDASEAGAPVDASDAAASDASDATSVDAAEASAPDAMTDAGLDGGADAGADAGEEAGDDAGACGLNPSATAWDVTADFSLTNNPCGVWTYGYTASLGSTPLTVYSTVSGSSWIDPTNVTAGAPTVWKNLTSSTENSVGPGQVSEHPGPHREYSTSRWTAPRAATYSFAVQFFAGDIGTKDAAVLHGTTVLYEGSPATNPTYSTTITMAAGDTFDVAVGLTASETFNYGNTPVTCTVMEVLDAGD